MTNDELLTVAIKKTLTIMDEVGVKYRKRDFMRESWSIDTNGNRLSSTYEIYKSGTVDLRAWFDEGERGKKLKKASEKFYNYFNCRVFSNYVRFRYTRKELELESIKQDDINGQKMEQVMAKIQKLLALSESDNEHEAISASLMAQKLLAKYNIDISDVKGEEPELPIEETFADVGRGDKWKYRLAGVVSDNYRCKSYFKGTEIIVFHGYRQDIVIARRVYMYLYNVCKRLASAYVRKLKSEGRCNVYGVTNSFCAGFIRGVDTELSKQCTELMLITPKKVEEEFEEMSAKFGVKNTSLDMSDYKAYEEGKVEGKRALNAQYVDDNSKYIE